MVKIGFILYAVSLLCAFGFIPNTDAECEKLDEKDPWYMAKLVCPGYNLFFMLCEGVKKFYAK